MGLGHGKGREGNDRCSCQRGWKESHSHTAIKKKRNYDEFTESTKSQVVQALQKTANPKKPKGDHKKAYTELNTAGVLGFEGKQWSRNSFCRFLRRASLETAWGHRRKTKSLDPAIVRDQNWICVTIFQFEKSVEKQTCGNDSQAQTIWSL